MSQHTPGRWEAMPPKGKSKRWRVGARGVMGGTSPLASAAALWLVAMIDNGAPGDTLETEEANARLISAAPDLLAAAKAILAYEMGFAGGLNDCVTLALAAVEKAEGKPWTRDDERRRRGL